MIAGENRDKILEWKRRYLKDEFLNARLKSESNAIEILSGNLDALRKVSTYKDFCCVWNYEYIPTRSKGDESKCTRFAGGKLSAQNISKDISGLECFVLLLEGYWQRRSIDEDSARFFYDKIMERRIKNAKIFIVTLMFYLKDMRCFNVCTDKLYQGLLFLRGEAYTKIRIKNFDDYLEFNAKANELREEFDLAPQHVDFILCEGFRASQES